MRIRFWLSLIVLISVLLPVLMTVALLDIYGEKTWFNEPLHSSIEAGGCLVAIMLAALMTVQRKSGEASPRLPFIAAALLSMASLDAIHGILPVSSSFFWTRAFATFFGGLMFSLVWLPERFSRRDWSRYFPWFVFGLSTALGIYLAVFPSALPTLFTSGGTFAWPARAINVAGGCLYILAAANFFQSRRGQTTSEVLVFLSQTLMLGVAGLLFAFSNMWTAVWWLFHFLRFFSYLVVLYYVYLSFRASQQKVADANLQLAKRNAELDASNRELEAFCYSVSHDLRTPLRGINGFSQALIEDYGDVLAEEPKQFLAYIREGVVRMGQIIDDLLNLSRVNRAEMRIRELNISDLAAESVASLENAEPARKFEFVCEPNLLAHADRGLAQVVLDNLIGNAWKFTRRRELPRIEFGRAADAGSEVFFVRDNGAGFDMAFAHKLFRAFQRLHSQEEFPGTGTGIGLATVGRIVERHGGQAWAESELGRGTVIYFSFIPNGPGKPSSP